MEGVEDGLKYHGLQRCSNLKCMEIGKYKLFPEILEKMSRTFICVCSTLQYREIQSHYSPVRARGLSRECVLRIPSVS